MSSSICFNYFSPYRCYLMDIWLFKGNNRNTRTVCLTICSNSIQSNVSILDFKQINAACAYVYFSKFNGDLRLRANFWLSKQQIWQKKSNSKIFVLDALWKNKLLTERRFWNHWIEIYKKENGPPFFRQDTCGI